MASFKLMDPTMNLISLSIVTFAALMLNFRTGSINAVGTTLMAAPPIFLPSFKQIKTILFTFLFSLVFLTQWYDYGMSSTSFLLVGLLFLAISVTICRRKILKKPSLGDLLKQFRNRFKK